MSEMKTVNGPAELKMLSDKWEMPNGIYVIEKRAGHWMVWAPDDDQPLYVDYSYDLVKLMMKTHSKEQVNAT